MSVLINSGYIPRPGRADSLDDPPDVSYPYLVNGGAYDDEFDSGTTLDPKWTRVSSTFGVFDDVNAIDPYWNGTGSVRSSHNVYRPSWYMVQTPSGAGDIRQSGVSFPNDCFLWARLSFNHRYNAVVNNDSTVQIGMFQDLAGAPDPNNRAYIMLNESETNTIQAQAGCIVASVDSSSLTANLIQTAGQDTHAQNACYVGIQRKTNNYDFWLGWPNSHWVRFTSRVAAITPTWILFSYGNATNASPGNMIEGIDFIRLYSGSHLP